MSSIGELDEAVHALVVTEEKRSYILHRLNPILQELVTQMTIDLPVKDLHEYALIFLVNKAQTGELDEHPLQTKNKMLKKKLARLKGESHKVEHMKMELYKMNPEYFSSIPTVVGKLSKKSDEQMQRLKNVLDGSFFFADLSQEKMSILLDSMEEVRFNGVNSEVIISKRVDADQMYIIEKGNPSVSIITFNIPCSPLTLC